MAKEIYSLDEDKMVEVEEPTETEEKDAESGEEEQQDGDDESDEESTEEDSEEQEKNEEQDSGNEEEPEEEEQPKDEDSEEEEQEPPHADEIIKNIFGDKYGVKSEADFKEILDESVKILDENEKLTAKIAELEKAPKEPAFKSESQKAVFEMLKDYDPERIPDGLNMLAALVSMDVTKTDPKMLLEQKFIMEHPELNIERARRKFQRDFDAKYSINEDEFEDPQDLKEKKKDIEEDLEIEAAQARKFLKEKQKEVKIKSEQKDEKPEESVNEHVQQSIAKNTAEFDEHFKGIHTLTFQVDEKDPKNLFNYEFSKDELARIKNLMDNHLKHPSSYDDKGNMIGGFDPESKFQTAAFAVCGQQITERALKFAQKYAQVIKAEDIASRKPERKAKSAGRQQSMSIDDQAERLAKKKKEERESRARL